MISLPVFNKKIREVCSVLSVAVPPKRERDEVNNDNGNLHWSFQDRIETTCDVVAVKRYKMLNMYTFVRLGFGLTAAGMVNVFFFQACLSA